jgi:hypothetical protein
LSKGQISIANQGFCIFFIWEILAKHGDWQDPGYLLTVQMGNIDHCGFLKEADFRPCYLSGKTVKRGSLGVAVRGGP